MKGNKKNTRGKYVQYQIRFLELLCREDVDERDCESEQTDSVLSPKLMASIRPVLTAIASAIKAEPMKQRFVDVWRKHTLTAISSVSFV